MNRTEVSKQMVHGQNLKVFWFYHDIPPGANALAGLRNALRKGIFPGDGQQKTYNSHMQSRWHEDDHIFSALNDDFSFWSELQRTRVWPNRNKINMFSTTGFWFAVNADALLEANTVWYCHTSGLFVTGLPLMIQWFAFNYREATRHMEITDRFEVQEWLNTRAYAIQQLVLASAAPIFPLMSHSTTITGIGGLSTDPDKEGVATEAWWKDMTAAVAASEKNNAEPRCFKLHQLKLIQKNLETLKFEVNGAVYYGIEGAHTDIEHLKKCPTCGSDNVVGVQICTNKHCQGPVTAEVRRAMNLKAAKRVWT